MKVAFVIFVVVCFTLLQQGQGMTVPLVGVFLFYMALSTAEETAVTCLNCYDVASPSECRQTMICGKGEICYTREFIDHRGIQAFSLGCEEEARCNLYLDVQHLFGKRDELFFDPAPSGKCYACCKGDECNRQLCQGKGGVHNSQTPPATTSCGLCPQPACPTATSSPCPNCYCPPTIYPPTTNTPCPQTICPTTTSVHCAACSCPQTTCNTTTGAPCPTCSCPQTTCPTTTRASCPTCSCPQTTCPTITGAPCPTCSCPQTTSPTTTRASCPTCLCPQTTCPTITSSPCPQTICPTLAHQAGSGFPTFTAAYKDKYYFFSYFAAKWSDARDFCQKYGADMVSINSKEEQEFLMQHLNMNGACNYDAIWTGGVYSQSLRKWEWVDGSTLFYTHWATGEPETFSHNSEYHIVMLNPSCSTSGDGKEGRWISIASDNYNFICEKQKL